MSKKVNTTSESATKKIDDKVISDLIEKRKLQQEALIKIMSSMDKNSEQSEVGDGVRRKKRFGFRKNES